MNNIKKAGIIGGAIVGGIIGGTISVVGKVAKNKFIDNLGESIVDSTILTGTIAGDIASGATHLVSGKIKKDPSCVAEGSKDLKAAGGKVVGNFVENTKTVINQSGEILDGVKCHDKKKVVRASKTLAKMVFVGAVTVGAIKVKEDEDLDLDENQDQNREQNQDQTQGQN
ncbi:MAG: hypothetical protein ACOX5F_02915 [Anaerovoracaceae bacterium]|jgi:hypothetical protein